MNDTDNANADAAASQYEDLDFMNEELEKNRGVLKQLQDTIVEIKNSMDYMVKGDEIPYPDDTIKLLEEAVVRISRLEKGLAWSVETIEMIQKELIGKVKKFGRSEFDSDELKWVKSLLEKNDDNNNSS